MMMARKSNPYKMLKLLYVIPVAVLAVAAFANPHVVQASEKVTAESNNVVNYVKELPKTQETPIMNSAQIKKDAVSEKMEESHVVGVDTAAELLPEPDISASINNKESGEGKQDVITEQPPSFQGGAKDLNDYLGSHIRYPADALERHIQGGVSVWVTISETGKVLDVEIAHSTSKLLNAEAIRVVKSMPLWNPALQNGKPIQVKCGFQINFNFK
jgi:TonB family protein